MSDFSTYTYGQLLNDVKIESRNSGNTEQDIWILGVINEVLSRFTALTKYQQFFNKDEVLTLTTNTEAILLPSDLQHLDKKNIRYFPGGDYANAPTLLQKYDKRRNTTSGRPIQFIRQTGHLLITPFAQIETGDTLLIDYWNLPPIGITDTIFPIPELIATVKMEVVARSVTFDDPKQWQRYKSEAKEQYIASKAVT